MSSLQERAAARRQQLEQDHSFVLPLPGYEDMFAVRYRALSYGEMWRISDKNGALPNSPETDMANFADLLINGCVEFLEVKPDGSYQSLGHKWGDAKGINESFGLGLPEGATARECVFAVFSGPQGGNRLALHAAAYDAGLVQSTSEVAEETVGESGPSEEGLSS